VNAQDQSADQQPLHDAEMQQVLGVLSSHPKGMQWRSRISFSLALLLSGWLTWHLVPLLSLHHMKGMLASLFPAGLFGRLLQSSSALPQQVRDFSQSFLQPPSPSWSDRDLWMWFVLAFLAGLLVATGLSDRWAAFQAKKLDLKGFSKAETWPFPVLLAVAVVGLLFALPVAAFVMRWLPLRWEIFVDAALLSLLWALLAWAGLANPTNKKRRFTFLLGAAALWAVPFYNAVVGFFSQGIGSVLFGTAGKLTLTPVLMPAWLEWTLLGAGLVLFLAWIFWPKSEKRAKTAAESAESAPLDHKAVVDEVLASLRTDHRVVKALDEVAAQRTSPPSANPAFWPLFMHGLVPTNDQITFLEKHRTGSFEFARRVQENPEQSDWWNGFNLLLAGSGGSGRTTALIAAALYSATAGGATSLVIAPRPDKRRWLCHRIKDALVAANLHTHFDCEELTAGGVLSIAQHGRGAPSLLVVTPQDLEEHIFGLGRFAEDATDPESVRKSHEQNLRLEALVNSLHAVFVENLSDFDPVPRSHLAFQLEKLRLRMAAKGRGMTSVAACPAVDADAASVLGARIFGETGFRPDRDLVVLHPAQVEKACLAVEIETTDPAAVSEEVTGALLRKNLSTVLFRKGIDEESCAEQQRKISAAAGGGRLVVIGDLDQRFEGGKEFDSVVYQNLTTLDATVAVGLRFAGETTVVFHIRPSAYSLLIEPEDSAMPVVAGRESPPLVTHHTVSFWSGCEAGDNVEQDWMRRLVPEIAGPNGTGSSNPPLIELTQTQGAPGTAWHQLIAFQRAAPAAFRPVGTTSVPDNDLSLAASPNGGTNKISIARKPSDAVSVSTKLRWISSAGQSMGQWSLDNSPVFLLRTEDGTFSAASVNSDGRDITIAARHYVGKGDDLLLPSVSFGWEFPSTAVLETIGGGTDFGASWFRVMEGDKTSRFEILGELSGLISEKGLFSAQTAAPFRFDATASMVVVGSETAEVIAASGCAAGSWSTSAADNDRRFLYDATVALTAFLCSRFNGPSNFCWPVVFNDKSRTVIWIIEPTSTGSSVSSLLFALLATSSFRETFLHAVKQYDQDSLRKRLPPAPRIGSQRQPEPQAAQPVQNPS